MWMRQRAKCLECAKSPRQVITHLLICPSVQTAKVAWTKNRTGVLTQLEPDELWGYDEENIFFLCVCAVLSDVETGK